MGEDVDGVASGASRPRRGAVVTAAVGTLFLVWGLLFAVLPPLLPTFRRELGLSGVGVGLLAGASGAGLLVGASVGALMNSRRGPRVVLAGSSALLAVACVGFGTASTLPGLVSWRIAQGAAGGLVWSAGLSWLLMVQPRGHDGRLAGGVFALENVGMVLGPALGAAALSVGVGPAFAGLGAFAAGLAVVVAVLPDPGRPRRARSSGAPPGVWTPLALLVALSAAGGVVNSRVPIELSSRGATGEAVGVVFLVAAVVAVAFAPFSGRLVDRGHGDRAARLGLLISAIVLSVAPAAPSGFLLAALCVVWSGVASSLVAIPAVAAAYSLGARADRMAWTAGATVIVMALSQSAGAAVGGVLASVAGPLPFVLAAGSHAGALAFLRGRPRLGPARRSA